MSKFKGGKITLAPLGVTWGSSPNLNVPKTSTATVKLSPRTGGLPAIRNTKSSDINDLMQKRKDLMAKSRAAIKRNVIITVRELCAIKLNKYRVEDHLQGAIL